MLTRFKTRLYRHRAGVKRGLILVGIGLIIFGAWIPASRYLRDHVHQWRVLVVIIGALMVVAGLGLAAVLARRKSTLVTVRNLGQEINAPPSLPPQERAQPRNRTALVVSNLSNFAAVIALIFTALSLQATKNQLQISEQGQITDRYNAAIANLGSTSIDIRLGGIYALQRLMVDSPRDRPAIIAVLCAFVRDQSGSGQEPGRSAAGALPTDLQAVLAVVGQRNPAPGGHAILIDLDRARLVDAHLDYLGFAGANLTGADLLGADLSGARLKYADLAGADLNGAVLTGAKLAGANLVGTKLAGAQLNNSTLIGADFKDADLSSADLSGADLSGPGISGASFSGAKLPRAVLAGANLAGLSFAAADLAGADLTGADLTHGYLVAAQLARATLAGAGLSGADLTGADLTGADIHRVNFTGASLSYANLTHAYVYGARLIDADLSGANLSRADLNGADLSGADLTGADLTRVHVVNANLTDAHWPAGAAVPDGWRRNPISGRLEPTGHRSRQ
jgi:uncharacterized protein YjbI with pentapeptide repeats